MRRIPALWCLVAAMVLIGSAQAASLDQKAVADQIKTMTGGAQTKIAWCRSVDGRMDYLGPIFREKQQDKTWVVMVFGTEEGRERVFAPAATPDAYCLPLITPNGERLIWTRGRQDIFIADWNGRNARLLLHGLLAKGVAEDPPGTEWVYVGEDEDPAGSPKAIYRYQIDKPSVKQLVWNKTATGMRFEVSRDGKWAVSEFGGNNCALASFPNGNIQVFGQGCNSGLVFDDSFRTFYTLGGHTGIQVQDKGGANGRFIKFDDAPGRNGANVEWWWPSGFHWDPRFLVFSGPWAGPRHDRGNIIVAQFNDDYRSMKQYIRVTDIPQSETYCYAWLAPPGQALRNAFGPSPTDKLTVKLLAASVRKFTASDPFKPTLDELEKAAADGANTARAAEAKRIVGHILGWGRNALRAAQGQETTDLPAAVKTYKVLATNYAGLDIGDEAKKKLDDPGLAKDLEAWPEAAKVLAVEKALSTPAAGPAVAAKTDMAGAKAALEALKKDYATTKAATLAQESWTRIEAWPKTQTDAAQKLETENPPEAEAAYKAVIEKFPDSEFAKAARTRLDDPGFKRQLAGWVHLKTILKAEESFVAVPGAQAQASDKAWGGRNAARLSTVRSAAKILKKDFSDTAAWKEAEKVLQKYGIDVDKK